MTIRENLTEAPMTPYCVYDVFTDAPFGGNPLAIIPDATGLAENKLQAIAREFNFSETTFVYLPDDAAHQARVRIFTPTMEIPFAGHPTIGTALCLHDLGRASEAFTLELGVGPIPIRIRDGKAQFTTRVPLETWPGPSPETVAKSVDLPRDAIRLETHNPIIASVGLPFALAELRTKAHLGAAQPDTAAFRAFDAHWPTDTHYDLLVYVRDGNHITARMFAPLDGIPEDPATGSAAAALTAYLGKLEGKNRTFQITQGVEMGRPSRIDASVTIEDGAPSAVSIEGTAVKVMEGHLLL
ncbi:MAG: PhzF family phenazine biosynthesis protein [Pseudomonadota bacterium]